MAAFPKTQTKRVTTGTNIIKSTGGVLYKILVNKTLTGTITVLDGSTTIALITNGTGTFDFMAHSFAALTVTFSGTDDVSVCFE